jgi:MFS family permease
MRSTLSALAALFVGLGLIMISGGLQGTLLGVRATLSGFESGAVGVVMSSYYVGFLVGAAVAPGLIRTVGHIRVFAAMASLASLAPLIHSIAVVPWVWLPMRILSGMAFASLFIIAESWLNDRADNSNRGRIMSLYMIVCAGGLAAGQFLLLVADPNGFVPFVLVSVLLSLAVLPIALSSRPVPQFESDYQLTMRSFFRLAPLAAGGIFFVSIAYGAFYGMAAVFATEIGMSTAQISTLVATGIIGSVLGQWPIGYLSDRADRRRVIVVSCFAAAGACALIALGLNHFDLVYAGMFLFGALSMTLYSVLVAHANDCLDPQQMVGAASTIIRLNGAGSALGPLCVALATQAAGDAALPLVLLVVHLVAGGYGLYWLTRRPELGAEDQLPHHIITPRASSIAVTVVAEQEMAEAEANTEAETERVTPEEDKHAARG